MKRFAGLSPVFALSIASRQELRELGAQITEQRRNGAGGGSLRGVVRLTGTVDSQTDRLRALTLTRPTDGVRSVVDEIRVASN